MFDFSERLTPYEQAWERQKELVADVLAAADAAAAGSARNSPPPLAGALLLVQHPPVYTLGAGSSLAHLGFDPAAPPLPLFRTERGGEVTYHGPGQLVAYPILDLRRLRTDLHWYLRALEEVVIRALRDVSGLEGFRRPGLTGVWLPSGKVAAIGVRARRWVAYHGLALNVAPDLAPFAAIVPCGIAGANVTSVAEALQPGPAPRPAGAAHAADHASAARLPPPDHSGGAASTSGGRAEAAAEASGCAGALDAAWEPAAAAGMSPTARVLPGGGGQGGGRPAEARQAWCDPYAPEDAPAIDLSQLRLQPGVELQPDVSSAARSGRPAPAAEETGADPAGAPRDVVEPCGALMREYAFALLVAFEGVFGVELVQGGTDWRSARLCKADSM